MLRGLGGAMTVGRDIPPLRRTLALRWLSLLVASACLGSCVLDDRHATTGLECAEGVCACVLAMGDCDSDPANGCETRLDADARNCGACGRDCFEGECRGGRCTPFQLASFGAGWSPWPRMKATSQE